MSEPVETNPAAKEVISTEVPADVPQDPPPPEVGGEPEERPATRSRANPQARSRPRAVAVLYDPASGAPYTVGSPAERTRLVMGGGYSTERPYMPEEHKVEDVIAYMREHPEQAAGIMARERARGAAARKTIISP